jgi:hypothetical protein
MGVTIKQVLIGTVVSTTVVGLSVMRLRKEKLAQDHPTLVASVKKVPAPKKHAGPHESELSSRKLVG